MAATPTVLYILATSRSGSTLLERVLATMPQTAAAGELVHLWTRGLRDDERCGCGQSFSSCARWRQIGDLAFGGWDRLDPAEQVRLQGAVDRQRHMLRMARVPTRSPQISRYASQLSSLYRAIAIASDAVVVVDSSKHASTAFLLRHVPGIDLRVVHLIRDPRGVVSSWSRATPRPEAAGQDMHRVSVPSATLRWIGRNLQGQVATRSVRSTRVTYESLVTDPHGTLANIAQDLALPWHSSAAAASTCFTLGVDHTVAGNPMRFRTGEVQLKLDERWRRELSPCQRFGVSAATWPLRKLYGTGERERVDV